MREAGIAEVAEHAGRAGDQHQAIGAQRRAASWLAMMSALMLSTCAAGVGTQAGEHRHVAGAARSSVEQREVEADDVADEAEVDGLGPAARRPPRGGRLARRDGQRAGAVQARPAARRRASSAAHRSTLSCPATHHLHDVEASASSVTRRPATMCGVWPSCVCRARWPAGRRRAPPPPARRGPTSAAMSAATAWHHRAAGRTSPPSLTTWPATRGSRPRPGSSSDGRLVEPQHEVHVLDRLAGAALDEVVDGATAGHGAACRRRRRPARSRPRRSSSPRPPRPRAGGLAGTRTNGSLA